MVLLSHTYRYSLEFCMPLTVLLYTVIYENVFVAFSPAVILLLGILSPLRDQNYRFPYPFIYLVKSLPFHIPESPEALRSFWVELLRMGRYIKPAPGI